MNVVYLLPWFSRRANRPKPWERRFTPKPPRKLSRATFAKLLCIHSANLRVSR